MRSANLSMPSSLLLSPPSSTEISCSVVCSDAPLTPPLSPKQPHTTSESTEEECLNPQPSAPVISQISPDLMDVDTDTIEADSPVNPLPRPQRLLEDEKVHLQHSGINLSDFEVRGTLGS